LEGCWRAQRPQLIRGGAGRGRTPVDCVGAGVSNTPQLIGRALLGKN